MFYSYLVSLFLRGLSSHPALPMQCVLVPLLHCEHEAVVGQEIVTASTVFSKTIQIVFLTILFVSILKKHDTTY